LVLLKAENIFCHLDLPPGCGGAEAVEEEDSEVALDVSDEVELDI
jgi:hypothetical protein